MARTTEMIKVDKETFSKWQMVKEHGDIAKIFESLNDEETTRADISLALNKGVCTQSLKDAINKYFGK